MVARNNEGNASLIASGTSGLLFSTAAQAVEQLAALAADEAGTRSLRASLSRGAQCAIAEHHSLAGEVAAWQRLLDEVAAAH